MNHLKEPFEKKFEANCFKLITEAYDSLVIKAKMTILKWNENSITKNLNDFIENNPKSLQWRITPNVEQPVGKDKKKEPVDANKLSRIDLRFVTINSNYRYKYYMEAKNLKENDSDLKKRYIEDGIKSFLDGKYPGECLLGYILEGDLKKTVYGINNLLKNYAKEYEILKLKPHRICHSYYESVHNCGFIIKHLMFDFTSIEHIANQKPPLHL